MKRLLVALTAAVVLAVPSAASAMVIDPGGGGGGGACVSGIMTHEGSYSGWIPYFGSNSFVQLSTTITNVNVLGFLGTAQVSTYPSSTVSSTFFLWPYGSTTIVGPTYTIPWSNTRGVPYTIYLSPISDAYALAYWVCV